MGRAQRAGVLLVAALALECSDGPFRTLTRDVRLPSGKQVKVVSCAMAWGVEHEERHPDQDGFALEYIPSVPREPVLALEQEVVEVFELIRPASEQWGFSSGSVSALRNAERTGTYDVFGFTRSPDGSWSHKHMTITRNRD
jgi:hypothetical protein